MIISVFLLLAPATEGIAENVEKQQSADPLKNKILAVYDSRYSPNFYTNELFTAVQPVLEHLGLIVDYYDAFTGEWPDEDKMKPYLGVVTKFTSDDLPDVNKAVEWLTEQVTAGRKLVLMGIITPIRDTKTGKLINSKILDQFNRAFGITSSRDWYDYPANLKYGFIDKKHTGYERKLPIRPLQYHGFELVDKNAQTLVEIKRKDKDLPGNPVVFVSSKGGLALAQYSLYYSNDGLFRQWYIDPFYFFEEAFNLKGRPRFDICTISGRRILYSHIDGDALNGFSKIDKTKTCGEIIRDEILTKYDFPITASVISADVDPEALGNEKSLKLAKSIFELKNVEAASHTFSHPFYWKKALNQKNAADDSQNTSKNKYGLHLEIPDYKMSLEKEINGSVDFINSRLLPEGKQCQVFQWSGDCRPPEKAIEMVENLNLAQINGGDSLWDGTYPSITGMASLMLQTGKIRQLFNTNSNENIYTNNWIKPFWGYRRVVQTFERTESPKRLRPVNIYYHYFSGANQAALNAVKYVYNWAAARPLAPIYTSHYLQIVKGFIDSTIIVENDGSYSLRNYGRCRTVRFDGTKKIPDLERSKGVQGFRHYQGNLYVYLNSTEARVYLTSSKPSRVYLEQAGGTIENFSSEADRIRFDYKGWGKTTVILGGLKPGTKVKTVTRENVKINTADIYGRLMLLNITPGPVELEMADH